MYCHVPARNLSLSSWPLSCIEEYNFLPYFQEGGTLYTFNIREIPPYNFLQYFTGGTFDTFNIREIPCYNFLPYFTEGDTFYTFNMKEIPPYSFLQYFTDGGTFTLLINSLLHCAVVKGVTNTRNSELFLRVRVPQIKNHCLTGNIVHVVYLFIYFLLFCYELRVWKLLYLKS